MLPARVLIVDDHATFAELLAQALVREPDFICVGFATDIASAMEQCGRLRPDVVVMDYHLPDGDGISAAERLLVRAPDTRVVMLTGDANSQSLTRAAESGICAFLPKDGSLKTLLETLRHARNGGMMVHPQLVTQLCARKRAPAHAASFASLTHREVEVLRLMAAGKDVRTNARALNISENTCRGYVKSILSKLGAHSQLEAVAVAGKLGLLLNRHD
ncbi:DNA-binding response regulator [Arthrobacter sp. AET 35A]|nr:MULTISPECIES: response regulator transcription factor [unclassified Arthrobacter]MBE0009116.1 DNA-binding response regulator [Arthrobacter sp. AET 35A]NOJ60110.1 response regulator transcription factor [Arthrobacter sp. 260]NOJ63075.1 response regulator transcription factor [Arthrobacter sp. 147(2020)]